MVLENLFLFKLSPFLAIFLLSLAVTLFVTFIYKFTTNQDRMKNLKQDQKKLQAKYKKHMKEPEKAMKIQKELMAKNMEYTKHSFKSTLYTFIPLIILFAWMNAHFAYQNIEPDTPFTTTMTFVEEAAGEVMIEPSEDLELLSPATRDVNGTVTWELKGPEGFHTVTYAYGEEIYALEIVITKDWTYKNPLLTKQQGSFFGIGSDDAPRIPEESQIEEIKIDLEKTTPFGGFSLFGWHPGWLATYIVFSIVLSILLRKWLKVY